MKNKILSYLLGGFLAILLNLSCWYAQQDCAAQCKNTSDSTEYTTCMAACNQQQQQWDWWSECKWIKLNTNFPIIGNCINTSNGTWANVTTAFPIMMNVLAKIVVSIVLVVCFILVIVAWIMRAGNNPWSRKWWWAKWLLKKVAITVLLLWLTWVILKTINPVFFS